MGKGNTTGICKKFLFFWRIFFFFWVASVYQKHLWAPLLQPWALGFSGPLWHQTCGAQSVFLCSSGRDKNMTCSQLWTPSRQLKVRWSHLATNWRCSQNQSQATTALVRSPPALLIPTQSVSVKWEETFGNFGLAVELMLTNLFCYLEWIYWTHAFYNSKARAGGAPQNSLPWFCRWAEPDSSQDRLLSAHGSQHLWQAHI